jgi:hypothetical protein
MLQILDGCAKNGRHGVGAVRRRALTPFFGVIFCLWFQVDFCGDYKAVDYPPCPVQHYRLEKAKA